ncbi:cyclic nucleotide-binding domain-containing protein 2 [Anolis carolinensis]|uniref:cyclic nucleotide-binding domain-containing protein 2 n=1 Tax=Anolis carolinensis TaxID=28377 RepID=UPI002F2B8A44
MNFKALFSGSWVVAGTLVGGGMLEGLGVEFQSPRLSLGFSLEEEWNADHPKSPLDWFCDRWLSSCKKKNATGGVISCLQGADSSKLLIMSTQPWRKQMPTTKLVRPWLSKRGSKEDHATCGKVKSKNFYKFIINLIRMIRVCRCFRRGLKGFQGYQLIEKDFRGEIEEEKTGSHIVFEQHEFIVSKDHFPFRAIQITRKPPAWRTDQEVRHLKNRLQLLESFRQYSPTLQTLLARVVRFEQFGRRRVIIKKGQSGCSFYFIYFGTVAVTDDEDGTNAFVQPSPTLLHRGACFGEVALLQGTKRMATVVCMEETELLVVDKKDFFNFKLNQELKRESKIRFDFLRTLDLFASLPDSSIEDLSNVCKAERSHYGQVITNDLSDSSNVVLISKGVCEVLRLVDLTTCPSYHKWLSKQLCFPKRKLQIKERRRLAAAITSVDRFKSTMWSPCAESGYKLAELKEYYTHQQHQAYSRYKVGSCLFNRSQKSVVIGVDTCDKSSFDEEQQHLEDEQERVQNIISGREFENKLTYTTSYGEMPVSVSAAVYMRMDQLHKGEYIANLQDNRTMILVSKGAEIIRLKKEKIEEFSDDTTRAKLSNLTTKYPSDDELCQVFLRHNSWEMFKKDLVNHVMQPKLIKMVYPPHPCPTDETYASWCMNESGILDLTLLRSAKQLPPRQCRYVPTLFGRDKESLPVIQPKWMQPKLIHGINVFRSNLDGAF